MLLPCRMVAETLDHVFRHAPGAFVIGVGQGVIARAPQFDDIGFRERNIARILLMIALRLAQQQVGVIVAAILYRHVEFLAETVEAVERVGEKRVF